MDENKAQIDSSCLEAHYLFWYGILHSNDCPELDNMRDTSVLVAHVSLLKPKAQKVKCNATLEYARPDITASTLKLI